MMEGAVARLVPSAKAGSRRNKGTVGTTEVVP